MTTRCPHCFTPLASDSRSFRCANDGCDEVPDASLTRQRGYESAGRPAIDLSSNGSAGESLTTAAPRKEAAACPLCSLKTTHEICPTCHEDLLPGWREWTTTCIAMAGARASGKSIYIAVLVKQAELWCEQNGGALLPLDARTKEVYERVYESPLYERRGIISPTPSAQTRTAPQRSPLLFSMGRLGGRQHVLVIRDVAGEDLEDPDADRGQFGFFSKADLVAFLFDPLRLADVREQLAGIAVPQDFTSGDPLAVLRNLLRLMGGEAGFAEVQHTPLAVVLAKFDTVTELGTVDRGPLADVMRNAGATFHLDRSMEPAFVKADADNLHAEVESLLIRLHAQSLLNLASAAFSEPRFFAVSALGDMPEDAGHVSVRGIAPFRVLDPLKWALARQGLVAVS